MDYIDLHSHWVIGVDDGVQSAEESASLLRGLQSIGFKRIIATPHMRPNMFDNTAADLRTAFEKTVEAVRSRVPDLPDLGLASEHFFDALVFNRLVGGEGLPYPGENAVLIEFPPTAFPAHVQARFFDLRRKKLRPVLAHPERYQPVWKDHLVLEPLVDSGTVLLLDVAALDGKYGRASKKAAERLVDEGFYYAACSDAHKPADVEGVARGIERLRKLAGDEEANFLLSEGPQAILDGRVDT